MPYHQARIRHEHLSPISSLDHEEEVLSCILDFKAYLQPTILTSRRQRIHGRLATSCDALHPSGSVRSAVASRSTAI